MESTPRNNASSLSLNEKRCKRCGWPIVAEGEAGCWESNCSMRPMPPERSSEISYNERDCALVHSAIGCLEPVADRDWDGKWRIKKALAFLSQVGDTPTREPVSLNQVYHNEKLLDAVISHDGTFYSLRDIAQIVLDAAGYPYVD